MEHILQALDRHRDMILDAERHIWNHPETGYREWNTHAYLKKQFQQLGYELTEAGNIPGFWTDVDTGRPGPAIAVFGEMDSLIVPSHPECSPETGAVHACGHHCQCAALIGIAAALKAPGVLDDLCGRIRLIAVPAEELIELSYRKQLKEQGVIRYFGGKQEFMYRGALDGVDISFMVHTGIGDTLECDGGSDGCVIKEAVFTGISSHAGGAPHWGKNALYAATCAINTANALRETFQDSDHIRFHPIITAGGDAVNAIPDRVVTEAYLRGATVEATVRESKKINRAFAGSAAAMGCGVHLWDHHGYAPRSYDPSLKDLFRRVGEQVLGPQRVHFNDTWSTGCSDMGDVSCVMPVIHPNMGGASGVPHGSDFMITDPHAACVDSARVQCAVVYRLLCDDAAQAKQILAQRRRDYPSIEEYLASIDAICMDQPAVIYHADDTVILSL